MQALTHHERLTRQLSSRLLYTQSASPPALDFESLARQAEIAAANSPVSHRLEHAFCVVLGPEHIRAASISKSQGPVAPKAEYVSAPSSDSFAFSMAPIATPKEVPTRLVWSTASECFQPARNSGEKCKFSHDLDDVPLSLSYKRRRISVAQPSVQSPPDPDNDCLTGASVVDPIAPEQVVDSPKTEPPVTPLVSGDVILPAIPAVMPVDIAANESATTISQTSSDAPLEEYLDASGESDIASKRGTTYGA